MNYFISQDSLESLQSPSAERPVLGCFALYSKNTMSTFHVMKVNKDSNRFGWIVSSFQEIPLYFSKVLQAE